jgi:hypothetical protein
MHAIHQCPIYPRPCPGILQKMVTHDEPHDATKIRPEIKHGKGALLLDFTQTLLEFMPPLLIHLFIRGPR